MAENYQTILEKDISQKTTRKELVVPPIDKDKTRHQLKRLIIPPKTTMRALEYSGNKIGAHLDTRVSPVIPTHRADIETRPLEAFQIEMQTEVDKTPQGSEYKTDISEKKTYIPNRSYHQRGAVSNYILDGERFQSQDKQDEFTIFRDGTEKTPFYQELVRQAIEIARRYPDAEMDRVFLLTRLVAITDFNRSIALYPSENKITNLSEENMSQRRAWVLNMLLQDEQVRKFNTIHMPVTARSTYIYGSVTDPLNTNPRTCGWVRYLNESGMEYILDPSNLPETIYPNFWKADEKMSENKIPLDEEDILEILAQAIPKKVAAAAA